MFLVDRFEYQFDIDELTLFDQVELDEPIVAKTEIKPWNFLSVEFFEDGLIANTFRYCVID